MQPNNLYFISKYKCKYYFLCPNCKTMYMVEEAKTYTTQDNSKELF
ncbi:MAG: hypothetical protein IJ916_04415 [Paludibacteraceae bacterium]|nr:hypothetical protein [Paludibacteraceae bacterium]